MRVKIELYLLLCTNDKKYVAVRRQTAKEGKSAQTVIIGVIASAIGASLGVVAGALVPVVAVALLAAVRVGKEASCSGPM
jgi:hypothetical protein